MKWLLAAALLVSASAVWARPRRLALPLHPPLPRQDPRPRPSPDFQVARPLLMATRMRADAFQAMKALPRGDDALRPAQEGLDQLKAALHPDGYEPAAKDAISQPLLRFDAAMAQAQLVARHPATPQDLADSLRLVADAGDDLVSLDEQARASRLSEHAAALGKALGSGPAAAP